MARRGRWRGAGKRSSGEPCDAEPPAPPLMGWAAEGGRQVQLTGLRGKGLENDAATGTRKIRRDASKWKNDTFPATIVNSKCQKPLGWKSQKVPVGGPGLPKVLGAISTSQRSLIS